MYVYVHTHVHSMYIHRYIHAYMHTYVYTYIHAYIRTGRLGKDGSRVCQNSKWAHRTVRMTPVGAVARKCARTRPNEQADLLSSVRHRAQSIRAVN
jgi:hypothetical protein